MDLDILWKAIVPLAFLAIWALTALFNREATPLPTRLKGEPNPYAPRPPAPLRTVAPVDRPPTLRWGTPGVSTPPPKPGGDDDIVILDSPRPTKAAQGRGNPGRRAARPKAGVAAKPAPIVPTKLGLSGVNQSVNQQISSELGIEPLTVPISGSVARSVTSSTATKAVDHNAVSLRTVLAAAALTDPVRLREAILINEILQPPVSLRGRPRRGW